MFDKIFALIGDDDPILEFNCHLVYSAFDSTKTINHSIYLISGDFTPFLIYKNKRFEVTIKSLHAYYKNHSFKDFHNDVNCEM
jgi:hypothetical protein